MCAARPRVAVELACEGADAGRVRRPRSCVVLAQPAFRLTASGDWLKKTDLAVTFQDRYGKEVGRRGILHDDAVTLDQYPDYVVQAVLATEDRRFYDHWGVDPIGLGARADRQRPLLAAWCRAARP